MCIRATDMAGNLGDGTACTPFSVSADTLKPAVGLFAARLASPANATSVAYALTFSEPVTGLASGDFTISGDSSGWSVGSVAGSGAGPYVVTLTGSSAGSGSLTLSLKAGAVSDGSANTGPAAATAAATLVIDRTKPTGTFSIEGGAAVTTAVTVSIAASASDGHSGVVAMAISNDGAAWFERSPVASLTWNLTNPTYGGVAGNGPKTVHIRWRDGAGNWSAVVK
jgi:hypothetical protein